MVTSWLHLFFSGVTKEAKAEVIYLPSDRLGNAFFLPEIKFSLFIVIFLLARQSRKILFLQTNT